MLKNSFVALVKREVIENKNGFIVTPVVLLGLAILLMFATVLGFANNGIFHEFGDGGVTNIGSMLNKMVAEATPDQQNAGVTIAYWSFSTVPLMVMPFIIFFSLLGSLYEERRDRTIMFWKSMPVSDWQEVLAKLVAAAIVAPLLILGVMIVAQLLTAVVFSITSLIQGGPVGVLWPLGTMIMTWINFVLFYALYALWVVPLFAWLLLASAYAPRMPFMVAVLPPVLVIAIQAIFFSSQSFAIWLGFRLSGASMVSGLNVDIDKGDKLANLFSLDIFGSALANSLSSGSFWLGLVVAGGLLWGAVELRKRAI